MKNMIHYLLALLAVSFLGVCAGSEDESLVRLRLNEVNYSGENMRVVECWFDGLPQEVDRIYQKRIVYSSGREGESEATWILVQELGSGERRELLCFDGWELVALFAGNDVISFPEDVNELALFEGKTVEGLKLIWFVGFGDPEKFKEISDELRAPKGNSYCVIPAGFKSVPIPASYLDIKWGDSWRQSDEVWLEDWLKARNAESNRAFKDCCQIQD